MILTVTLNPCVHKFVTHTGGKGPTYRPVDTHYQVGGKGINVARAITRLGGQVRALSTAGGHIGSLMRDSVSEERIQATWIPVQAQTRMSTFIADRSSCLEYLEEGGAVSLEERAAFVNGVREEIKGASALILSGSSPHAMMDDVFSDLLREFKDQPLKIFIDTYGPPARMLSSALKEGFAPYFFKANRDEIAESFEIDAHDKVALEKWASSFLDGGADVVVVSDAGKGAILYTKNEVILARPPQIQERNPVGSGDAMLGAMALSIVEGKEIHEAFRDGVAAGAQNASLLGICSLSPSELPSFRKGVQLTRSRFRETLHW